MMFRNVSCAVLIAVIFCGCEQHSTDIVMVRPAGDSNVNVSIAEDFANLLDDQTSISVSLTDTGMADADALDALIAGEADIALVSNSMPYRSGISTVMSLYPIVLHISYFDGRDDTDGRTLFEGAKVFAGPPGSASRFMFESILTRMKLKESDVTYVPAPYFESPPDMLPDVAVLLIPISPAETFDQPGIPAERRSRIRIASMGSPVDIGAGSLIDSATLLNPHLEPFVIPVGTYGDLSPDPVLTLAVDMMLVARRDLDSAIVYDLVREVIRHRPALAAQRPGMFGHVSSHLDTSNATFVLHPGAVAYERRDEPSVYERYSGIAEVVVTAMVGLISAGFAGTRMYQYKRKNRIDVFYAKIMEIRNTVGEAGPEDERSAAVTELKELQTTAFQQLIDEKLAADESFRIFLTMSNEVIQEFTSESAGQCEPEF